MEKIENGMSALTRLVRDDMLKGYQLQEIAERHNIPVTDAVKAWKSYTTSRMEIPAEEQWVLYLERLENLLVKANAILENSELEQYKDVEAVLKILTKIEELQNLNKSRQQEASNELLQLSEKQGALMIAAFQAFAAGIQQSITQAVEGKTTIKAIKGELVDNFPAIVDSNIESAFQTIEANNDAE